mmetsp:Transcript_19693/g.58109  ORF Transcript_19693/g.58109 Transcript_19693/m.58109 type:complete len:202 (+) Transcript_19693:474-1079(+)
MRPRNHPCATSRTSRAGARGRTQCSSACMRGRTRASDWKTAPSAPSRYGPRPPGTWAASLARACASTLTSCASSAASLSSACSAPCPRSGSTSLVAGPRRGPWRSGWRRRRGKCASSSSPRATCTSRPWAPARAARRGSASRCRRRRWSWTPSLSSSCSGACTLSPAASAAWRGTSTWRQPPSPTTRCSCAATPTTWTPSR